MEIKKQAQVFVTVSQAPSGKYFVSVLVEAEHVEIPYTEGNIGLDLGIKDLEIICTKFPMRLSAKTK